MSDGDDAIGQSAPELGEDLRELLEKLSAQYNFDLREYKEVSLVRRIRARMTQVRAESVSAYSRLLDENAGEHVALINTILINVTGFFRDSEAWKVLAEHVVPRLVEDAADSRSLRIWSTGCSSGEEAYSIAILLAERLGAPAENYTIKIYGTDVDEEALTAARQAVYRTEQLKDVPDRLVDRYFTREGQLYRFRREIRRWCIFGSHNLTQAPPLSHIDLLVCRNALIYFTGELQDRILTRFHYSIREDGFLFLGRSESLLARSRLFTPVHQKWRIFRRTSTASRPAAAGLSETGSAPHALAEAAAPSARVQRALDALPAAVVVIDVNDTILSWNPGAEALLDIPTADALARKFRDLDISYRVEGLRARIEDVKARHAASRMDDVMFTRRNGEAVHTDITIAPLFEASRFVGVLVYALEATEHARLKEQMTRLAEQHSTAIEELQSTNEELETTNEELQSTNEELKTTNEELQSTNEELEAANAELGSLNTQLERRGVELKNLDEYQQSVLSSLQHAIVVLDRHGLVTTWNQTAERLWGLPVEHVVRRLFWTLPVGDIAPKLREALTRMLDSGSREAETLHDVPFRLPTGETRHLTVQVTPLESTSGEVTGVVGIASPMDSGVTAPAPGGKPR